MKTEFEIEIRKSNAKVCAELFNINGWNQWLSKVEAVDWITPQPLIVGSYFSVKSNILHKELGFTFKVVEFEKNKKLKVRSTKPYNYEITIKCIPTVNNTSIVTLRQKIKPSVSIKIFYPISLRVFKKQNSNSLSRFKKLIEAKD